jgi:D-xylonolactonase
MTQTPETAGEPAVVVQERCVTGEGPLWHPDERRLYWTDIPRGRLFRLDPQTGRHEQCYAGPVVGGFTIQADGALLLFQEHGRIALWRGGAPTPLIDEIPAERDTRFNDVIADPAGRVFCGTMPSESHPARLYRLDLEGALTLVLDNVGQANGMGFTPDGGAFYFTDTRANTIVRYRYDLASGDLSDPQLFAREPGDYPVMDGLTVDADGYVWSARYGGGCLVRYAPDGREVGRVAFPTSRVTSAAFAGDSYRDLYVTTAGGDTPADEDPTAGALFRLSPGVAGRPEFRSRVRCAGVC